MAARRLPKAEITTRLLARKALRHVHHWDKAGISHAGLVQVNSLCCSSDGFGCSKSSTLGDEIVLGPPKISFASATAGRNLKTPDASSDKRFFSSNDEDSRNQDSRAHSVSDALGRNDRNREKAFTSNDRRNNRDERESWTSARMRKEEGERGYRPSDRDRSGKDGEGEGRDQGPRRVDRNAKDRFNRPWDREGDSGSKDSERSAVSTRTGGWRDRDRDRERDREHRDDRDWGRNNRIEEDPEWMDTAVSAKEEKKQAHTQEEFQRWKERMKASSALSEEKDKESTNLPQNGKSTQPAATFAAKDSKPATPLALDPNMFNLWADSKRTDGTTPSEPGPPKIQNAKSKSSRFAGFFAPQEETKPVPEEPLPIMAPKDEAPKFFDMKAEGSNEDREGFQRILQMLGGASLSSPPQPPPNANGTRPQHTSPDPYQNFGDHSEGLKPTHHPQRSRDERNALVDAVLNPQGNGLRSPPQHLGPQSPSTMDHRQQLGDIGRQMPSREGSPSGGVGLHGLMNNHPAQGSQLDRNSEFLLNLMQQKPPLGNPSAPRHQQDANGLPLFMENKSSKQATPNSKMPPPGLFDQDRNMMGNPDALRRNEEMRREMEAEMNRKQGQRGPSNIFEDPAIAHAQRRTTGEGPPRPPLTNMGIPQQPMPDPMWMKQAGAPPMQDRIAPPPGFGGNMRPPQPPGFGGPQMPFAAGNPPMGHPFMSRGGMPPYPPGQGQMMPPPPGYFPGGPPGSGAPPGFPPMGEGMMGIGGPPQPPQQRRPNGFEMFQDVGRPAGRGGPPPGFGI